MGKFVRGLNLIIRPHQSRNNGFDALDGMRSEKKMRKEA
jgi:virulence-associated protein VagC